MALEEEIERKHQRGLKYLKLALETQAELTQATEQLRKAEENLDRLEEQVEQKQLKQEQEK
ncbi:hypothetical protein N7493_008265 [Penicillium malachiteum]|uniref:Uncharacterized protein n=1 Tax=Penicillium malachiteum TaxID=1324776 RepID=A0AAD6HHI0_9EURO|nr:hypothetical protein N7493_008265 [Penicillium malachiteum]